MCHELRILGQQAPYPLHSIYFGGGTPSLLPIDSVERILSTLRESFPLTPDPEISFELNPNDGTPAYLDRLYALGVNRLSIGMQSAHGSELRLFARTHHVEQTGQAVQAARSAGFTNLSLDLIYGIPKQTLEQWQFTVDSALAFEPDHLSLYSLQVEPDTPFADWVATGKLPAPDDDLAADMYDWADQRLLAAGLIQYEISTWSKPGKQCRHNLSYWTGEDYLGVGAGAHGYAANWRYTVIRSPQSYIEHATHGNMGYPFTPTLESCERVTSEDAVQDYLMTGLRLRRGVSREAFEARFGLPIEAKFGAVIERLTALGLLIDDGQTLILPSHTRLIAHQVLVEFIQDIL
jgi:oxygen-independent coproporphyrinogen-3 oxidase